ncbi:conserved hypothetical protein [Arthrobacter sp. Hiyo6]|jgi:hypothetical protein|nr:conserved hypothetical protein [Arthrobacter sp. Hiyo6]
MSGPVSSVSYLFSCVASPRNRRFVSTLAGEVDRTVRLKRRALIPAEGYYEWQKTEDRKEDRKKVPNYLHSG